MQPINMKEVEAEVWKMDKPVLVPDIGTITLAAWIWKRSYKLLRGVEAPLDLVDNKGQRLRFGEGRSPSTDLGDAVLEAIERGDRRGVIRCAAVVYIAARNLRSEWDGVRITGTGCELAEDCARELLAKGGVLWEGI